MSDENLQRLRREALQGDAVALTRLEAEILRRRHVVMRNEGFILDEIIEIAHPFKKGSTRESQYGQQVFDDLPIVSMSVDRVTDETVTVRVIVSAVHATVDGPRAPSGYCGRCGDMTTTGDPCERCRNGDRFRCGRCGRFLWHDVRACGGCGAAVG